MRLWPVRRTSAGDSSNGLFATRDVHSNGHVAVAAARPARSRPLVNAALFMLTCLTTLLAGASLARNPLFQHQMGEADAKLRAARILLHADAAAAWVTAAAGGACAPDQRARIRSTATWAAATAASVVDTAYRAGGGTSLYSVHPLQRRFRDVHALTQHFLVKLDTLTTAGAVLAGAEADLTVF